MHEFRIFVFAFALVYCVIKATRHMKKQSSQSESPYNGEFFQKFSIDELEQFLHVYTEDAEIYIRKLSLYVWLEKTGRLEWVSDYFDPRQPDGHGQQSGTLTPEQYFEYVQLHELKQDVTEYIKSIL